MLPPVAPVVIVDDNGGGDVDAFEARIAAYRQHHVAVRIRRDCASACTMLLDLPKVCIERGASLSFHQAFLFDPAKPDDDMVRTDEGTAQLWAHYPLGVRDWITAHGGLRHDFITLRGAAMARLVPMCRARFHGAVKQAGPRIVETLVVHGAHRQ